MTHVCNTSIQETKAGECPRVQIQSGLCDEFQESLGHTIQLSSRASKNQTENI